METKKEKAKKIRVGNTIYDAENFKDFGCILENGSYGEITIEFNLKYDLLTLKQSGNEVFIEMETVDGLKKIINETQELIRKINHYRLFKESIGKNE